MNKQEALFDLVLRLGDNSLILGHRLSELCSHGPFLEEDIATTNIALDLVGQSRILLSYAGQVEGKGRSEDDLAYFRNAEQFRCCLLSQLPNGDFAYTNTRLYFYSVYASLFLTQLMKSKDETLAGYAAKAIKETTYHIRHSGEWLLRFGDGTEESHDRLQKAVDAIWMYTGDMFATTEGDKSLIADGIMPDFASLKSEWYKIVSTHLKNATITVPDENAFQQKGSREGKHLEALTYILGEMQVVARAHPGVSW
ncbi:MAG TPA: 1,2-phenylacetyl-CoA epoxidase subunit PaaC [Bacteroidia bacterium]|jgi:ring-1,2-phenylacetyl-CoA epoxidase subunit PaaC|nr:1,2-phenylacetyl-CoA epoxidase subunit PaaC [Bacteroidia bacterium]